MARQNSGQRSAETAPARATNRSTCIIETLSRLATDPALTPSVEPRGTSVASPRTVVVTGATRTRRSNGATRDLVITTTGRTLSKSAHQIWPWPSPFMAFPF